MATGAANKGDTMNDSGDTCDGCGRVMGWDSVYVHKTYDPPRNFCSRCASKSCAGLSDKTCSEGHVLPLGAWAEVKHSLYHATCLDCSELVVDDRRTPPTYGPVQQRSGEWQPPRDDITFDCDGFRYRHGRCTNYGEVLRGYQTQWGKGRF